MSEISDYYDLSRIRPQVQKVLNRVNELGREKFAGRAKAVDDDASFPVENYRDLAAEGFLGLCIPEEFGGWGFSMFEYAMVGAEIGKYCGATALTFNMHTSAMLWSNFMFDMPNLTEEERAAFRPLRERQFRRVVEEGAIYSQPISEGGQNWTSNPVPQGGWRLEDQRLQEVRLAGRQLRLLLHRMHGALRRRRAAP